jgi:hypothetical protein
MAYILRPVAAPKRYSGSAESRAYAYIYDDFLIFVLDHLTTGSKSSTI